MKDLKERQEDLLNERAVLSQSVKDLQGERESWLRQKAALEAAVAGATATSTEAAALQVRGIIYCGACVQLLRLMGWSAVSLRHRLSQSPNDQPPARAYPHWSPPPHFPSAQPRTHCARRSAHLPWFPLPPPPTTHPLLRR
jgi:hypothetical protein